MIRKIVKIDNEKCNGCGACARACHEGAITFEEREAPAYDHAAVLASKQKNWPLQIKLVPVAAPYFDGARLLIAADCTAFAYANFYDDLQKGKVTLIGCPKLDAVDYSKKITEVLKCNDIYSITVLRMEVPCQVLTLSTHGSILSDQA